MSDPVRPLHRRTASPVSGEPRHRAFTWLCVVVLGLTLLLSGCAEQGITDKAHAVHRLYGIIILLAGIVFAAIEGWLLFNIVRYRRRRAGGVVAPQIFGESRLGLLGLFAIPSVIIAVLFPFGEATLQTVQKIDPNPMVTIKVTGFQWEWTFDYLNAGLTESGVTLKRPAVMELPVDEPVHILLDSNDVLHEFYVPELLFMRNAIPGHRNDFSFTPTQLGTFQGQCAEFCGLYHNKMTFVMKVVTREQFVSWVTSEKARASSASCAPQGDGATITAIAHNVQWNTNCFAIKAATPYQVKFVNQDAGIPHNFAIYNGKDRKTVLFRSDRLAGPVERTFSGKALAAGRYYFQCDVHGPSMSGVVVVK